jgi:hypothetical protein
MKLQHCGKLRHEGNTRDRPSGLWWVTCVPLSFQIRQRPAEVFDSRARVSMAIHDSAASKKHLLPTTEQSKPSSHRDLMQLPDTPTMQR